MPQIEGYRLSYFVTGEKRVKDMIIMMMQSGITQKTFPDLKEANKFLNLLMRLTDKDNSFLHYNLEEIQSILLESRGKITRDNKIKESLK